MSSRCCRLRSSTGCRSRSSSRGEHARLELVHLPPVHTFTLADSENSFALTIFFASAVVVSSSRRLRGGLPLPPSNGRRVGAACGVATELLRGRELDEELEEIATRTTAVLGVDRRIELGPANCHRRGVRAPARSRRPLGRTLYTHRARTPTSSPGTASYRSGRIAHSCRRPRPARARGARGRDPAAQRLVKPRSCRVRTTCARRSPGSAPRSARCEIRPSNSATRTAVSSSRRSSSTRPSQPLVGDLLDLSRLEAGGAAPELQFWSLDDLALQAVDSLDARFARRIVGEGPLVNVDAMKIQRVLANLIENALEVLGARSPCARPHHRDAQGGDRPGRRPGPGPCRGRDRARLRAVLPACGGYRSGAGLGLAIARGFAAANGGRVWAESRPEQGATFALALPVVDVPAELRA